METTKKREPIFEEIRGSVDEIIHQVKALVKKGNARRVMIVNKNKKVLFQSSLTIGTAGATAVAVVSPFITAIGFFAVVLSDMKVVVEKYPEATTDEDEYEVEAEVIEIEDEEQ